MTILYEFAVTVPDPTIVFIGTVISVVAFVILAVTYSEDEYITGTLIFIALLVIGLAAIVFGINRKESFAIAKIETFADYEKVNTENKVVQLLEDNVFLVEMKSKKNDDETSGN